jgi:poly(3-hydroxybutyrate) depolymerase
MGAIAVHLAQQWFGERNTLDPSHSSPQPQTQSQRGALKTHNANGRSGAFFLPKNFSGEPRPLLVLFHGTGGNGDQILQAFVDLAEEKRLIVVAPDSGLLPDGTPSWQVGSLAAEVTTDRQHAEACISEVLGLDGVRIDPGKVLAAGHSGGASSAPYIASNDNRFTAFAVLHGGVFPGGLGSNRVPGWFSTGEADTLRPPAMVRGASEAAASYAASITLRTYSGGHDMSAEEVRDVVAWWLTP